MVVSVNFCGLQRKLTRTDQIQIPLVERSRVSDLLTYLKKRYPELPLKENVILITVNNKVSSTDHVLEPDDRVSFIPHIGGG